MDNPKHCEEHGGLVERVDNLVKVAEKMEKDLKEIRTLLMKAVIAVAIMAASGAAFGDWARGLVISLLGK